MQGWSSTSMTSYATGLTSYTLIDKTEVFLELYGNCFVREKTAQMLTEQATKLIKYVGDNGHHANDFITHLLRATTTM